MTKTDLPVRAHSENNDGYKAFVKDKRARTTRTNDAVFTTSYRNRESGEREQHSGERRHSFNPNFTRDNRLTERNRQQGEYRAERSYGNREGGYNREERGGYNRERTFNREGGYQQRSERDFNREGGYNRERSFNREGGYQRREREAGGEGFQPRERNFNREGGYQQRGERSFNREERNFNREGFQPRERNFNREERGAFGSKRGGGIRPTKAAPKSKFAQPKEPKKYINTANEYTLENYPSYEAPKQEGAIRLNRYISMSGICSRREADEYIAKGEITVNGVVVTELGSKVMPNDEVCYNGKKIENEKKVYIVMNKPKGFVTTLDDPHADKSVMDLVKNACTERIYPVGRLDKNSVGVLLLTNDGDLAKKLTHPTYEKKKIYQVSLDKHLTRADLEQLILGVTLEDGYIAADDVCYVDDPKMKNAVGIEIHSGRNRIVRRMFEHVGYHVGKLDRVYFAGLTKQKLKRGEWRFLTEKEVAMLKSGSYE
ncbi:MAG: pseudouridine synthase [Tidjanibacter sp.]|nr:pseudouridine synthase [Tidjanibacter sp.]